MASRQRGAGQGWFRAGTIGLFVFAAVHLIPFSVGLLAAPTDPAQIEVDRALRAYRVEIGPVHTTMWHLTMLLSASYSVFLVYIGVLNLVVLRAAAAAGRLGGLAAANLFFCAILAAICAAAWFPPPFVFTVFCSTCFAISVSRARRSPAAQSGAPS
jgi:hypothetical protein